MAEIELNRDNKLCAKCQAPSLLFCSKCRITPYCSMDCQKGSWKRHKTVCRLNGVTPSTSNVAKIENEEDFDMDYSYILIKCADSKASNTLAETVARLSGLNFLRDGSLSKLTEGNILLGFSHEDSHVYRYQSYSDNSIKDSSVPAKLELITKREVIDNIDVDGDMINKNKKKNQNASTERNMEDLNENGDRNIDFDGILHNKKIENNLVIQLLMIPNCFGDYIIYKTKNIVDGDVKHCEIAESSTSSTSQLTVSTSPSIPSDVTNKTGETELNSIIQLEVLNKTEKLDETKNKEHKITRREIWEMIEYRYLCSLEGVVTDRIHRINMQRKEGLLTLKETKFTDI